MCVCRMRINNATATRTTTPTTATTPTSAIWRGRNVVLVGGSVLRLTISKTRLRCALFCVPSVMLCFIWIILHLSVSVSRARKSSEQVCLSHPASTFVSGSVLRSCPALPCPALLCGVATFPPVPDCFVLVVFPEHGTVYTTCRVSPARGPEPKRAPRRIGRRPKAAGLCVRCVCAHLLFSYYIYSQ